MGIMGNSDHRLEAMQHNHQPLSQFNSQSNGRSRVGLTPTDGRDAYKRSSTRSSRRSRSERTSYLMATGHLDPEETKQFNEPQDKQVINNDNYSHNHNQNNNYIKNNDNNNHHHNHNQHHFQSQQQQLMPKLNQQSRDCDLGRFKRTYTEIPSDPFKTSPAFEYILQDHRRRNKRCCLWFVYSALMTICVAIILFCSAQLVLRYHHH